MPKLHEIETYYTYDMILDLLEILDVKSSLTEEQILQQKAEMQRK